jgi:hypothetical protein
VVTSVMVAMSGWGASPGQAQGPEEEALATVHALFDAMRAGDGEALAAVFHEEARLSSTQVGPGGVAMVRSLPISTFVQSVSNATAELDERLWDEEVRVADGLATVWTPYALYVDGQLSHCGYDAFQLVRSADGWKVLQIADTRQTTDCEIPEHVRSGG